MRVLNEEGGGEEDSDDDEEGKKERISTTTNRNLLDIGSRENEICSDADTIFKSPLNSKARGLMQRLSYEMKTVLNTNN